MKKFAPLLLICTSLLLPASAWAGEPSVSDEMFAISNVWLMICTALVFSMHLGFAALESGLVRTKNTVNILFKNVMVVLIGLITYYLIGFNLMYPGDFNGFLGFAGFGIALPDLGETSAYAEGYTYWTDFLFQGMFAATGATIASGAVAERIKLNSFLLFTVFFVSLVYPIAGSWKWGGGWLDQKGFYDFAGSTLVHSVGGWAALIGAIMVGPRLGKYSKDGKVTPIPGSNLPMATLGVFILWLGWFGFNGGSVLSAAPGDTSRTLVITSLGAAAGGIGSYLAYQFVSRKPDLSMTLNGILAGLVSITAGADVFTPGGALFIGVLGGGLVVGSVLLLDRLRIDDPVGAISVHLVCGIWGTLAVGLFSVNPEHSLAIQALAVVVYGVFTATCAAIIFGLVRVTLGLRVSVEEEMEGLDACEHEMHAYEHEFSPGAALYAATADGETAQAPAE